MKIKSFVRNRFSNGKWWLDVEYDCYGVIAEGVIMFNTKEEAENAQ